MKNTGTKIMFFDIDGTLIPEDGDHKIPESAVRALRLAREAGNLLFINTGRPVFNVGRELRCLGFDGFVCGCKICRPAGVEPFLKLLSR